MTKSKFVIMKHEAKRAGLHYDLRFKMPSSKLWASFAVRKGVPTSPGQKVLAVKTHDHTEKEALFTGEIKEGYGAGKLTKWDGGSCDIIKYKTGSMAIDFKGSKVKGIYHLISTGVIDKDYKKQTYMLFKGKIVQESDDKGAPPFGMLSRNPPGDTQEVELDDEDADKQQTKSLDWAIGRNKIK
jgi:DNA ligase D-like protein (predicted 3'-phosphoesterase)